MPKTRIVYRVTIRIGGEVYYANREEGRDLPHCRWVTLADEYPDHFNEVEAIDICQLYSDQRPNKHKVSVNIEEKEDA